MTLRYSKKRQEEMLQKILRDHKEVAPFQSDKKYSYTYRITNNINGMFYIGVRSCIGDPNNDTSYMGSSKILKEVIKEVGLANFSKEVVNVWNDRQIAILDETRLLNQGGNFMREDCYNISNNCADGVSKNNTGTIKVFSKEEIKEYEASLRP